MGLLYDTVFGSSPATFRNDRNQFRARHDDGIVLFVRRDRFTSLGIRSGRHHPSSRQVSANNSAFLYGYSVQHHHNAEPAQSPEARRCRPRRAPVLSTHQSQVQPGFTVLLVFGFHPGVHDPRSPASTVQIPLPVRQIWLREHHEEVRIRLAGEPRLRQVPAGAGHRRRNVRRGKQNGGHHHADFSRRPRSHQLPAGDALPRIPRPRLRLRVPGAVQSAQNPGVLVEGRGKGREGLRRPVPHDVLQRERKEVL